jgi:hypothetical protein
MDDTDLGVARAARLLAPEEGPGAAGNREGVADHPGRQLDDEFAQVAFDFGALAVQSEVEGVLVGVGAGAAVERAIFIPGCGAEALDPEFRMG